jgi:hypothetical protein
MPGLFRVMGENPLSKRDVNKDIMMARILTLVCSVVILFGMADPGRPDDTEPQKTAGAVSVPAGASPVIDGTIAAEEWQGARRELFRDGSELLLLRHGEDLYLGIRARGEGMIAANVFIESGIGIAIYHASAALGTAVYRKDGGEWRRVRDFSWSCRRTDSGKEATDEREAFLREEGWVASNSRMGTPHELEYRIRLKSASFRLAAHFLRASESAVKIPWPVDLDDDTAKPTPMGLPSVSSFSPEKWATIIMDKEPTPR